MQALSAYACRRSRNSRVRRRRWRFDSGTSASTRKSSARGAWRCGSERAELGDCMVTKGTTRHEGLTRFDEDALGLRDVGHARRHRNGRAHRCLQGICLAANWLDARAGWRPPWRRWRTSGRSGRDCFEETRSREQCRRRLHFRRISPQRRAGGGSSAQVDGAMRCRCSVEHGRQRHSKANVPSPTARRVRRQP